MLENGTNRTNLLETVQRFLDSNHNSCVLSGNEKSIFGVHDIEGVQLLTRLRVQFNDLHENRFRHRFHCSNPMCFYQTSIEDEYFLLHCPYYTNYRRDLHDHVSNVIDRDLDSLTSIDLCNLLLYGNSQFPFDTNHSMIESTITFIKSTKRFEQRTREANPVGENNSFIFTVCVKSVPRYHFKLVYVVLHVAVKQCF